MAAGTSGARGTSAAGSKAPAKAGKPVRGKETARSGATRIQLLDAAERLFAEHGLENVTVRAIVARAGQKNASALHYHFVDRDGLIRAIHLRRNAQVQARRTALVDGRLAMGSPPSLRDICMLMVEPAFQLACADAGFRRYIRAFSEWSATTTMPAAKQLDIGLERGTLTSRALLRKALAHLDDALFARRFDSAVRFATLSMSVQARKPNAFRGPGAALFLELLLDEMAGLLAAEVSPQTQATLAGTHERATHRPTAERSRQGTRKP
jgi:AcrR family transcriptional regulator